MLAGIHTKLIGRTASHSQLKLLLHQLHVKNSKLCFKVKLFYKNNKLNFKIFAQENSLITFQINEWWRHEKPQFVW